MCMWTQARCITIAWERGGGKRSVVCVDYGPGCSTYHGHAVGIGVEITAQSNGHSCTIDKYSFKPEIGIIGSSKIRARNMKGSSEATSANVSHQQPKQTSYNAQ